jgi:hypothetical protein
MVAKSQMLTAPLFPATASFWSQEIAMWLIKPL